MYWYMRQVTITNIPTISTSTSSSFVDVSGPDSLSNSLQNTSLKGTTLVSRYLSFLIFYGIVIQAKILWTIGLNFGKQPFSLDRLSRDHVQDYSRFLFSMCIHILGTSHRYWNRFRKQHNNVNDPRTLMVSRVYQLLLSSDCGLIT